MTHDILTCNQLLTKVSIIYHYDYSTDCHLSLRVVQNLYTSRSLGVHRPLQPPPPLNDAPEVKCTHAAKLSPGYACGETIGRWRSRDQSWFEFVLLGCDVIRESTQWRRQLWGTGARAPLDFQQFYFHFGVNLIANYPSILRSLWDQMVQMLTTHSSFDQYCISHKTISHRAAAAPGSEVHRECPWHNFHLCPSSQQILATPPKACLLQRLTFQRLRPRMTALVPVQLYGSMCSVDLEYMVPHSSMASQGRTSAGNSSNRSSSV